VREVAWSLTGDTALKPAPLIFFVVAARFGVAVAVRPVAGAVWSVAGAVSVSFFTSLAIIMAFVPLTATFASLHRFFLAPPRSFS
jgi:hypothetical protein